jgi:2-methylfumaryl-CoA hydratase
MHNNKGAVQNFFEDFALGQVFTCPTPRVLTDGDRVAYIALTGDRTPLYCNVRGLVHPLIVFHTVLGQTVRQISLNAVANLGYAGLVWKNPVRVGDEISTTAEVVGLKENSNLKSGIVYVQTVGRNQHGEPVLEYIRWVMVKKNRGDATSHLENPHMPELPQVVAVHQLTSHPSDQCGISATGGRFWFDDYKIGERIFHMDGITVNASDHMSFARLYQNTARVHFDGILMQGTPLVYGGYPVSLGYAQAYNGLENRLGIAAINAGTHANPVHTGDTLYSFTEVLDCARLDGAVGALRLRLIVVKNEHLGAESFTVKTKDESGREKYHPGVVLDLDYWELMAIQPGQ